MSEYDLAGTAVWMAVTGLLREAFDYRKCPCERVWASNGPVTARYGIRLHERGFTAV